MDGKFLVMVVEDEAILLEAVVVKLNKSGFAAAGYESGREALESLRGGGGLPVAIWLDYYLKDMNGLEFMGELKKNPAWANIPVIVVSNSASTGKVSQMLALGAKKYLLKAEYRMEQIIDIIREMI